MIANLAPSAHVPRRARDIVSVREGPDISPLVLGIWAGVAFVLLCPHPLPERRRPPTEREIARAYGVVMTGMGLL